MKTASLHSEASGRNTQMTVIFPIFFICMNQIVGMGKDMDTDGDTEQDTPGISDTRIIELHLCTSGQYHNNWIKQGSRDCESEGCSIVSDSLRPLGYSPWNSPGQNTDVGSLSLLRGIFPTQG